MNLKKWSYLFLTTLLIGVAATVLVGLYLLVTDPLFQLPGVSGMAFNLLMMILAGAMFGVISHMGFFAYLTVHYIAKSIFRSVYVWNMVQLFLVLLTLFYLAVLRFMFYAGESGNIGYYLILPAFLLLFAFAVAYGKMKKTNVHAFIPTLFYMAVITTLELIPSIKTNDPSFVLLMAVPLCLCNAWQILKLHTLVDNKTGKGV